MVRNLPLFEQTGGLAMSRYESEAQWDYPYGWAPISSWPWKGCGARRLSRRCRPRRVLATVLRNYQLDQTIREKYDVVKGSEQTRIDFGYTRNETGFGWTNGVFLELLHDLPPDSIAKLEKLQ